MDEKWGYPLKLGNPHISHENLGSESPDSTDSPELGILANVLNYPQEQWGI